LAMVLQHVSWRFIEWARTNFNITKHHDKYDLGKSSNSFKGERDYISKKKRWIKTLLKQRKRH